MRGLTQDALALRLSISVASLRKLESGERRPSVQVADVIASLFKLPAEERSAFTAFARGDASVVDASTERPWLAQSRKKSNIPIGLTPLLGRERDLRALMDLLLQSRTRLVTLTGLGGVGKTRLATDVAWNLVDRFSDGCTFVDLATTIDPDQVLPAVAHALGLQEDQGRPLIDVLHEYVRGRQMLLVLDNFEQVLDAGAAVARLQQSSPWLKVLVTSREPLRVRGERRFVVAPLDFPDREGVMTLAHVLESPAVALFCQRAQDIDASFALTDANLLDVVEICSQLQGLPLAIELAAARVLIGSLADLRSALSDALGLLTAGARDLPLRQRTLRASIRWSYDLLSPDEQRLFRFLGTFVGGALGPDLIAAAPPMTAGRPIHELLEALTEKSLVIAESAPTGDGRTGPLRYRLLETLRSFACEEAARLAETSDFQARLAARYLALALDADRHFTGTHGPEWGPQQRAWLGRLQAEFANCRSALEWYLSRAPIDVDVVPSSSAHAGLKLARAMRRVWFVGGYFSEGLGWLRAFVELVTPGIDHAPAEIRLDYAEALAVIGRLAPYHGEGRTTPALLNESLSIAADLQEPRLMAYVLLIHGLVAFSDGAYAEARAWHTRSLELYRSLSDPWGCAAVLEELGRLALDQGDAEHAKPLLEESRTLFRSVGDQFGGSSVVEHLGRLAYVSGDYSEARRVWLDVLTARRAIGYTSGLGRVLVALGWVALQLDDVEAARPFLVEALQVAWTLGTVQVIYEGLAGLGALAALSGQLPLAARRFAAAETYRAEAGVFVSPIHLAEISDRVASARLQSPPADFDEAWRAGGMMATEAVVREVLSNSVAPSLQRK